MQYEHLKTSAFLRKKHNQSNLAEPMSETLKLIESRENEQDRSNVKRSTDVVPLSTTISYGLHKLLLFLIFPRLAYSYLETGPNQSCFRSQLLRIIFGHLWNMKSNSISLAAPCVTSLKMKGFFPHFKEQIQHIGLNIKNSSFSIALLMKLIIWLHFFQY